MRPKSNRHSRAAWLGACLMAMFPAWVVGQTPPRPTEAQPPASTVPARPRVEMLLDQQINQAREEIDVLRAQLEAKRALLKIGEARLEQATRWRDHFKKLLDQGKVTDDRWLAAKDDVLMLEAHVAGEKAESKLAEMRLKQAERRLAYGEFPTSPADVRLAEIESRMATLELKLDRIQHEVGRLRREEPGESRYAPR